MIRMEKPKVQLRIAFVLGFGIFLFATEGNPITMVTESFIDKNEFKFFDDTRYDVPSKEVILEIQACDSVAISLIRDNGEVRLMVTLDVPYMTESYRYQAIIMKYNTNTVRDTKEYNHSLLNCNEYVAFNLTWTDDILRIFRNNESDSELIVSFKPKLAGYSFYETKIVIATVWTTGKWRIYNDSTLMEVNTVNKVIPNNNGYAFLPTTVTSQLSESLQFLVKACKHAQIGLLSPSGEIHVIIGGISNTEILIHDSQIGASVNITGSYLNCSDFRKFVLNWNNTKVELFYEEDIGKQVSVMSYSTALVLTVDNIGIKTVGSHGEWIFHPIAELYSTTEGSINTTSQCPNNDLCIMICTALPTSEEEIAELIKVLQTELKVDKQSTSSFKNTRISAVDDRTSAAIIGYVGTIFLTVVFGSVVILDLPNLRKMIQMLKRNTLNKRK